MLTTEQLFSETMSLYFERGARFTMVDLSARLGISKKTLYEAVRSKDELAVRMVEYYFAQVAALQDQIHADPALSPVDKLKKLLCATPDLPMRRYHLEELKRSFPAAYRILDERLRQGWERTLAVLDQAKAAGAVKNIDNPLFSRIYSAAIEDILMQNDIHSALTFKQKQQQIVEILLFGIVQ
jgi:AcrR family transcriptional regulator